MTSQQSSFLKHDVCDSHKKRPQVESPDEYTYDRRIFDPPSQRTALSSRLAVPLKFPLDSVYRVLLQYERVAEKKPTKSSENRRIAT